MQEYSARTRRGEGLSWLSAGSQLYAACLRWYLASTSGGDVSATSLHRVGRETVASILSRIDKVFVTPTPIGERSIVMSVSVCLSVCLCVCLRSNLRNCTSDRHRVFLYMLPMAVARSSSGGVMVRHVLPVLWMTSCLLISQGCSTSPPS